MEPDVRMDNYTTLYKRYCIQAYSKKQVQMVWQKRILHDTIRRTKGKVFRLTPS